MALTVLQRSIFRELLITLLLAVFALNFILMTENLLKLTKLFSSVGASMWDMLRIIFFLQPQLFSLTVPMAFFTSTLLVYGRLNADSEITAMRACGMSLAEIARPAFLLGALCFLGGIAVSFHLAPAGSARVRQSVAETISGRAHLAIEEGIFSTAFRDIVIFVREKPSSQRLGGIFIYDERKKDQPRVLFAKSGIISGDGSNISLDLKGGSVHIVRGDSSTGLSFGRYNLILPVEFEKPSKKYSELTPPELLREANLKDGGDEKQKKGMLLEFWRRFTLPAVSLIFMLLGPPLAVMTGRTGKLGGLTIGLAVFTLYYMAMVYAENLARSGRLPLHPAAWAPAIALGLFALYMFRRESLK